MQLDSKERLGAGSMNVGNAANALDHAPVERRARRATDVAVSGPATVSAKYGWARTVARFAKNAAIGLLMMTAVPIVVAARRQDHSEVYINSLSERIAEVEAVRALMAPKNAATTPAQAGVAFRALQSVATAAVSSTRTVTPNSDRPWKTYKLTADMFPGRSAWFNGPSSEVVIKLSVSGFSKSELAFLQAVAEAPVWRDFDMVANARAVDVVGGYYALLHGANALLSEMPPVRFADTKELAYAGVSRAAYYLATGKPDQAAAVLRSVVSFGFALVDNGTSAYDALIGRIILGIGRDGLGQFYAATGRPIPPEQQAGFKLFRKQSFAGRPPERVGESVTRQRWIDEAGNPALPRALRFARLRELSFATCGNVGEMLFGPKADIRDAFAHASKSLARFPSEQAYLGILLDANNHVSELPPPNFDPVQLLVGAATIAATVNNNPRMAACTSGAFTNW